MRFGRRLAKWVIGIRETTQQDWVHKGKRVGFSVLVGANCACALHLFFKYVGSVRHGYGPSMLPTLDVQGELLLENCLAYRFNRGVARGDLITYTSPIDPTRTVCKRVIGLPGDIVCVDPTGEKAPSTEHVVVPKGHYWVMGDNAAGSRDSRHYGPVSGSLIRGKLVAKVWPLRSWTIFRNPTTYID